MNHHSTEPIALELELLAPATRHNRQRIYALLADDFQELGASGQRFGKAEVLAHLPQEQGIGFSATDMQAEWLSTTVVLIQYGLTRTEAGISNHSRRSSIWVFDQERWQMRYHQGTRVPNL